MSRAAAPTRAPEAPIDPRVLFSLRSYYFFQYAALGALFPFLPLLLAARGLAPSEISWVMVIVPLSNLVVPPLWGSLADTLRARLTFLRAACLGSALTVLLLLPRGGLGWSLATLGVFSFFRAPLSSLGDAAAYEALGGRRAGFATIRIWGSLGFAMLVLLFGQVEGPHQQLIVIVTTAVILLLAGASTLPMPTPPTRRERRVLPQTGRILKRPAVAVFLAGTAVYYTAHSAYDVCFSLHLRAAGHGDRFIGLAWAVGVVAEIALMLVAPRLMPRFRSNTWLILCAILASGRWLLLSVVSSVPAILGAQTLHAATFGLWYLALVEHAQRRAPAHLRTSLQAFTLAFMGLGMVAGYLASGPLFDAGGGALLFRAGAIVALAAASLYALSRWLQRPLERDAADIDEREPRQT